MTQTTPKNKATKGTNIINRVINVISKMLYLRTKDTSLSILLCYIFNYLLTGIKKEKASHYVRRRFIPKVGYSLNECSAISLIESFIHRGDKVRFVSQKLNFRFFNHGSHAIKFMNPKNENLTNYAEAILHYLSKHFSKESDSLTPEKLLSVAGNPVIKKETRSPFVSSTHLLFNTNGLS